MAAETLRSNRDVVYQALASTPLRKVATPEDIANQIVVLSSSTLSGHVTGKHAKTKALFQTSPGGVCKHTTELNDSCTVTIQGKLSWSKVAWRGVC